MIESEEPKFQKKKYTLKRNVEFEIDKDYLNIWRTPPQPKHINTTFSSIRAISLLVLIMSIIVITYLVGIPLYIAVSIGVLFLLFFLVAFYDQCYNFVNLISFTFRKSFMFNPFSNFIFWQKKRDTPTLYVTNKEDLTHIAIQLFKIEVIPENVHETTNTYIKTLSDLGKLIPFTYQVIHIPMIHLSSSENQRTQTRSQGSYKTYIYFCIHSSIRGFLRQFKIDLLQSKIYEYQAIFRNLFASNFHHFKITLLSGDELINGIRTFFFKESIPIKASEQTIKPKNSIVGFKIIFITIVIFYLDVFLIILGFFLYIIPINFIIIFGIIWLWWRGLLFHGSQTLFLHNKDFTVIHPFSDIKFHFSSRIPTSIFLHINDEMLVNLRMYNLDEYCPSLIAHANSFTQSAMIQKVPFGYTVCNTPISIARFERACFKHLNTRAQHWFDFTRYYLWDKYLRKKVRRKKREITSIEHRWATMRSGLWESMLLLSVSNRKYIRRVRVRNMLHLEHELNEKSKAIAHAFISNFNGLRLMPLHKRKLISGYLCSTLKTYNYKLSGTHLQYLILQGKTLNKLVEISDEYKKGVETRIGAEFNTPLHLKNFITLGHTLNTEILETEIPFGFTLNQLRQLLIVNGTSEEREHTSMKIAAELIQAKIPSLIFDFSGRWSKLISFFEGTQFEKELLYFKLGTSFSLDPLRSDIPYDLSNSKYQEFLFDVYGLAFRKDKRTIEMFRNTILKNPEMDLPSLNLEIRTQSDWEKRPPNMALGSVFSDLTQEDLILCLNATASKVLSSDFIKTDKTVIVDLSITNEFSTQLFFAFLIVSKLIHYITTNDGYIPKIIFMPSIDIFFDSRYITTQSHYGKIDKFLGSLRQHGFGVVYSANQVHSIHQNVFNYFPNIMVFKAVDNRDISLLKNLMNLQELVGTGYYSSKRNNTYQLDYLKNLNNCKALIKREDIYQAFPVQLEYDDIVKKHPLPYEEIVPFMRTQGYDLRDAERRLLEHAHQTIFEIDLGNYMGYRKEIMDFLSSLSQLDNIGNLYKEKLKKELLKFIAPKAIQRRVKKEHITKLRDILLDILIKHHYLVEDHSRKASGSQSIRTSYRVGEQYNIALQDYYQAQQRLHGEINVEVMDKEADAPAPFEHRRVIIQKENLKKALQRELSDSYHEVYLIWDALRKGNHKKALKIEHDFLRRYLANVYTHFHNEEGLVTDNQLNMFYDLLSSFEEFPYRKELLQAYVDSFRIITFGKDDPTQLYNRIKQFFEEIQDFIYS
ncbi:MAG: hypothetical protein ACFFB0_08540 [Promethearchaeota archaeon]